MKIINDFKEAIKILLSKEFWKDFKHYYSDKEMAKRLDNFTKKIKDRNQIK